MEEKLKEIILRYFQEYEKIPKPKATKIGGTYYGSTQLFSSVGNMLELMEDVSHTSYGYSGLNTYYHNCYLIKIGGAYKISTKELYDDLLNVVGKVYIPETRLELINDYGTNFSVIGFGYVN